MHFTRTQTESRLEYRFFVRLKKLLTNLCLSLNSHLSIVLECGPYRMARPMNLIILVAQMDKSFIQITFNFGNLIKLGRYVIQEKRHKASSAFIRLQKIKDIFHATGLITLLDFFISISMGDQNKINAGKL